MTVRFASDADNNILVHESQSVMIPVNVTVLVFGSLSGNTSLVLHYGESGPSMNKSISRTPGTQFLQIQLNCTTSVIQVTVTTNDPLVELQENNIISIHIGKKSYLSICTQLNTT